MVDIRAERVEITKAKGFAWKGGKQSSIWFNDELHLQILEEATRRHWTFSHMVRFLCEASIEGIE